MNLEEVTRMCCSARRPPGAARRVWRRPAYVPRRRRRGHGSSRGAAGGSCCQELNLTLLDLNNAYSTSRPLFQGRCRGNPEGSRIHLQT